MSRELDYFDFRGRSDCIFQFYIGPRGIGKSYSVYDEIRQHGERMLGESKWLYMRLTQKEIKSSSGALNCFKDYNIKAGVDIEVEYGEEISTIVRYDPYKPRKGEEGDFREYIIGYAKSLDTFVGLRSVSLADVDYIFFDEFIPELTSRRPPVCKIAGTAFMNAYETVSRNRELEGRPPVKCLFMGNANGFESDILEKFKILPVISRMVSEGRHRYTDRERSIYVEILQPRNVSNLKKDTAIYRLGDSGFERMAIQNQFPAETFKLVQKVNLPEYVPYIQYGDICIMKHKSKKLYHVRRQNSTARIVYTTLDKDVFYRDFYTDYIVALLEKYITFEDVEVKMTIDNVLNRNHIK